MKKENLNLKKSQEVVDKTFEEQAARLGSPKQRWSLVKLRDKPYSLKAAKYLSVVSLSIFLITVLWLLPLSIDDKMNKFYHLTTVAFFLQMATTLLMSAYLGDNYWVNTRKRVPRLDEREIALRGKVLARTYVVMTVLVPLNIMIARLFFPEVLVRYATTEQFIALPMFIFMWFIYGLPSMIAAWTVED